MKLWSFLLPEGWLIESLCAWSWLTSDFDGCGQWLWLAYSINTSTHGLKQLMLISWAHVPTVTQNPLCLLANLERLIKIYSESKSYAQVTLGISNFPKREGGKRRLTKFLCFPEHFKVGVWVGWENTTSFQNEILSPKLNLEGAFSRIIKTVHS